MSEHRFKVSTWPFLADGHHAAPNANRPRQAESKILVTCVLEVVNNLSAERSDLQTRQGFLVLDSPHAGLVFVLCRLEQSEAEMGRIRSELENAAAAAQKAEAQIAPLLPARDP